MLVWTDANHRSSQEERWTFKDNPQSKALLHFSPPWTGKELREHLVRRAMAGSPLHLKALAMLYAYRKHEFLHVMKAVPANKTGTLVKKVIAFARVAGALKGDH